jgi:hypothetical protein
MYNSFNTLFSEVSLMNVISCSGYELVRICFGPFVEVSISRKYVPAGPFLIIYH